MQPKKSFSRFYECRAQTEAIKDLVLPTSGNEAELLNRIMEADPEGMWMNEGNIIKRHDSTKEIAQALTNNASNISGGEDQMVLRRTEILNFDYVREIEFMRQEKSLMEREMKIMKRENELLRNTLLLRTDMKGL